MYISLIILILFAIGAGYLHYSDNESFITGAIGGIVVGLIPASLIGSIISIVLLGSAPMECKYKQDLIAIKDTFSTSASFFLGYGRIDLTPYYIYMAENDKGIKQYRIKQNSNEVYIKYTDGQPYVEYWDAVEDPWRIIGEDSPYYVFYLQRNSIVETYEINME